MRFLADENLSRKLVNALRRYDASIDIVRVQDIGLLGADDASILDWAVNEDRSVITKDRATIPPLVDQLMTLDNPLSKICIIRQNSQLNDVLKTIEAIAKYSRPEDWQYPLR